MDYITADAKLTGRNRERRKVSNNTYLERIAKNSPNAADSIGLRLHNTFIVIYFANGDIQLNSGGWRTVTTKARINEFTPYGISISQRNGQWFVHSYTAGKDLALFDDGIMLHPDGSVTGGEPLAEYERNIKMRRQVQRFAANYIKALFAGKVPKPGAGDCFYCQMREVQTGKPLGECTGDRSHLTSHLDEKYYVPSLLYRALEVMPVSQVMKWAVAEKWYPEQMPADNEHSFADNYTRVSLQKTLSRYMLRQMGQAA